MFCSFCSSSIDSLDRFCSKCGRALPQLPQNTPPSSSQGDILESTAGVMGVPTFKDFMTAHSEREEDRQSRHQTKGKGKGKGKATRKQTPQEVTILIGLVHHVAMNFKPQRGKQLPISVSPHDNASTVLDSAVQKFVAFGYAEPGNFVLLYPTSWHKVVTVPGTNKEFTVHAYREELGKQYSRVILYLCAEAEYLEHTTIDGNDDTSDENAEARERHALHPPPEGTVVFGPCTNPRSGMTDDTIPMITSVAAAGPACTTASRRPLLRLKWDQHPCWRICWPSGQDLQRFHQGALTASCVFHSIRMRWARKGFRVQARAACN